MWESEWHSNLQRGRCTMPGMNAGMAGMLLSVAWHVGREGLEQQIRRPIPTTGKMRAPFAWEEGRL